MVDGEIKTAIGPRHDREDEDSFLDWNGKATLFDDEPDEEIDDYDPDDEFPDDLDE